MSNCHFRPPSLDNNVSPRLQAHSVRLGCVHIACEQALRGTLVVGQEKEGELAATSLELEFHLQFSCGSMSTELSDFHQSAQSRKERECKQTLISDRNSYNSGQLFMAT